MKTVADSAVLGMLITRLERLSLTHERSWGRSSAHQIAVHLGDAAEAALGRRDFSATGRPPSRLRKWFALSLPLRWPRGIKSGADPAAKVLVEETFPADLERALKTLQDLASARDGLAVRHPIFGAMSRSDWQRWAWKHTDHHLRQFGL